MSEKPEVLLSSRIFDVVRMKQVDDQGGVHVRDIVMHPGAVAILPILDDGRIVLIKNYRIAAGEYLIEVPAGTREPNEPPQRTAERELAEETGYTAENIEHLTTFYTSPGCMREEMLLYRATGLSEGEMATEPGEDIELFIVSADEAMALVREGKIKDAKTVVALLWHALANT